MTLSDEIAIATAVCTLVGGLGAWGGYRFSLRQSKPQMKFDVSIRQRKLNSRDNYLYYTARNVGQVSVHMEWFGLRLASDQIFFQSYVMSYSIEVVPFVMPMTPRYQKEILPGKSYETSIDLAVFAQFFRQNGFKDAVQVTPYLGDERGLLYKGKPILVPLNET